MIFILAPSYLSSVLSACKPPRMSHGKLHVSSCIESIRECIVIYEYLVLKGCNSVIHDFES